MVTCVWVLLLILNRLFETNFVMKKVALPLYSMIELNDNITSNSKVIFLFTMICDISKFIYGPYT